MLSMSPKPFRVNLVVVTSPPADFTASVIGDKSRAFQSIQDSKLQDQVTGENVLDTLHDVLGFAFRQWRRSGRPKGTAHASQLEIA
jgi:hypothetical protein